MKSKTKTLLVISVVPFLFFFLGCTKDDKSSSSSGTVAAPGTPKTEPTQQDIENDLIQEQTKSAPIVDNSPVNSDVEAFRFTNEAQKFTLTKLGSLLNSEFECKATLKLAVREKEEKGTIKLSFAKNDLGQNEFKAIWWPADTSQKPFYIANKKEVCGEKIQKGTTKKAVGSLAKTTNSKTPSQYVLQYTVYVLDPVSLKMKWNEGNKSDKPGEMTCVTLSQQAIAKASIESCQLISAK